MDILPWLVLREIKFLVGMTIAISGSLQPLSVALAVRHRGIRLQIRFTPILGEVVRYSSVDVSLDVQVELGGRSLLALRCVIPVTRTL